MKTDTETREFLRNAGSSRTLYLPLRCMLRKSVCLHSLIYPVSGIISQYVASTGARRRRAPQRVVSSSHCRPSEDRSMGRRGLAHPAEARLGQVEFRSSICTCFRLDSWPWLAVKGLLTVSVTVLHGPLILLRDEQPESNIREPPGPHHSGRLSI